MDGVHSMNDYTYDATLARVVDGDTFDLIIHTEIDIGFKIVVKHDHALRVRLHGVDTPEMHTVKRSSLEYEAGVAAKEFAEEWFRSHLQVPGAKLKVQTFKDEIGIYGRYTADIWVEHSDGFNQYLGDELVRAGHATELD